MRHTAVFAGLVASLLLASSCVLAAPLLKLWRLDCGRIRVDDLNDYSDTFAYTGTSKRFVASCYLIQHDQAYLLWDTGLPVGSLGQSLDGPDAKEDTLSVTLVDQLKQIGIAPSKITFVGISHYHYDHVGQASNFPDATLLMAQADIDAPGRGAQPDASQLDHWIHGRGATRRITGDADVFGDGSVVMLDLPGHTPGHHGLLVRLPQDGVVILSGDAAHFRENYASDGVPSWNADRAQSVASMHRLKAIEKNLHATVVIQHEPDDVKKLPAFPHAAQ
jgi:glyoxylase-like metal-dependent hydrolase (beta-lactamase superfamily II)